MKMKKFDCVEMKRQGAELVRKETADLSGEQELAYWQKHTHELKKQIEQRKGSQKKSPMHPDTF